MPINKQNEKVTLHQVDEDGHAPIWPIILMILNTTNLN